MGLRTKRVCILGVCVLFTISIFNSCASTKTASVPRGWSYSVDWDSFNAAQLTPTDHILVQNKENMVMLDGNNGHVVDEDFRKQGGFLSQIKHDFKEQIKEKTLVSQRVNTKYFFKEMPKLNTVLLFNRIDGKNTISSVDMTSGKKNWESDTYQWNLNGYKDAANIIANKEGILGGDAASQLAFQTRLVQRMVYAVPEMDAFLFRSVKKLYLIDAKTGNVRWSTNKIDGTGIAAVKYLADSNQLLMATSMAGLKDVLKNATDTKSLKQLVLLNRDTGKIAWKTNYRGRSEQVANIKIRNNLVLLNFHGGAAEYFLLKDGRRIFGTRDNALEGTTKMASATGVKFNMYETYETAMPRINKGSVYAVSPKTAKAFGIPDKELQKFDLKTGKLIWSRTFEHALDIRDMIFVGNDVIVRFSQPGPDLMAGKVGNIVGKKMPLGFYAFSRKDGKLDWKLTDPFEKHVTNVIYGDNKAWAAGGETVYKFGLDDGHIIADSSLADKEVGIARHLYDAGDNIVYLGDEGMAIFNKADLHTIYSDTPKGHLDDFDINNRVLVMQLSPRLSTKREIDVYNLVTPKKITSFTIESPKKEILGKLGDRGFFTTKDFKQVVTLNETGLTSYKIF